MSTFSGAQMRGQINISQRGEICIQEDVYVAMSGDLFG